MRLSRYLKYQYYKMIRLKDAPSKVAQGVGLGMAMDFAVPIPLVSIFVSFVVARILKMNSLAAVMSSTFLKPLFPAIVALNLYGQSIIVKFLPSMGKIIIPHPQGTTPVETIINSIVSRGVPYLLAGFLNGLILFVTAYFVVYYVLQARINRIKHKKKK